MSRLLDGIDDLIEDTTITSLAITGAVSYLVLIKILDTGDTNWQSYIEMSSAGPTLWAAFGRNNVGELYAYNSVGIDSSVAVQDADGWFLGAYTKPTGTSVESMHKLPIGGARTSDTAGTRPSPLSTAITSVKLGGNADWANILIGAAAVFNVELTTGQLDAILTAKTSQSIVDLAPIWFADDGDSFANEYVSDRALTVGGTDDADDPSGWVYLGQTAAPVDYDYTRFPKPKLRELANR